jgi:hypothetical protein
MLLLSGSSVLAGRKSNSTPCPNQTITLSGFATIQTAIHGLQVHMAPLQSGTTKINFSFFENEEDDDLDSFKKRLKSNSLPTLFLTAVFENTLGSNNGLLLSYTHYYSYTSSLGSIGLQVFRI